MPRDEALQPEQVALAQLALMIADREERLFGVEPRRTEAVLSDAGLPLSVIARITARNYDTVKTIVRRSKQSQTKTS